MQKLLSMNMRFFDLSLLVSDNLLLHYSPDVMVAFEHWWYSPSCLAYITLNDPVKDESYSSACPANQGWIPCCRPEN